MAPEEPEAKVISAAPFAAQMIPHVQEAAKGAGALAAAGTKTRGLSNEGLYKMPPTPDGGAQTRSFSCQDRSQAGQASSGSRRGSSRSRGDRGGKGVHAPTPRRRQGSPPLLLPPAHWQLVLIG